jgi:hypothetical protein
MILCRTTLNPSAPAEIVGDCRRDDGTLEFYVERTDGQPWRWDVEMTHGGWCMFPCYTAAVRRSEISEIVHVEKVDMTVPSRESARLVVDVHALIS